MEILITEKSEDYELLDSGEGEKLERFGQFVLSRPDPQVLWPKNKPEEWSKANARFVRTGQKGKWQKSEGFPDSWQVKIEGITFSLQLQPSKHVGVFPEQSAHWKWLSEKIASVISPEQSEGNKSYKAKATTVLNLFAYTGGASLACSKAGADVVHVDSSEWAVSKAKENANLSGLAEKPIRFIVDDVRKFVEREIKRGNKYDMILLDPPVYGKGVGKEVWNIETDLSPLLSRLKNLVSNDFKGALLNGYSSIYSPTTYARLLEILVGDLGGEVTSGELAIKDSAEKLLPTGIFAKWKI